MFPSIQGIKVSTDSSCKLSFMILKKHRQWHFVVLSSHKHRTLQTTRKLVHLHLFFTIKMFCFSSYVYVKEGKSDWGPKVCLWAYIHYTVNYISVMKYPAFSEIHKIVVLEKRVSGSMFFGPWCDFLYKRLFFLKITWKSILYVCLYVCM